MDTTANLSLPYIMPSQAQKHVTHNEALAVLDALVQLAVLDRDLAAPPAEPAAGARYIVAAGASGAWEGHDGSVASFRDGAWLILPPKTGWLTLVADEKKLLYWDGTGWIEAGEAIGLLQNLSRLGVGTAADEANPFAAKLNNALWSAKEAGEGGDGDLRLVLNKESETGVLSLLLQSGYSGRAEIGLVGADDLSMRVSPDGVAWTEVLRGDRASGEAVLGGLRVGRDMVQNLLPDSGRFNGNGNNTAFSGVVYSAPTYLGAASGASIASHAKFIHNNNDYGGSGGSLDPEVKALIDKIRPPASRRYGPEWFVVRISQAASGPLSEVATVSGASYGLAFTSLFTALPTKFTVAYYVKVKTGSAALTFGTGRVARAFLDGVLEPASDRVITNADGWRHVCLHGFPNQYGYDYANFNIKLPLSGEVWLAMPKAIFGHVDLDPSLGALMNGRMYG